MTQIYIASETTISTDEFGDFLRQFIRREPLDRIELCNKLAKQCSNDVENRAQLPFYPVSLPSAKYLSKYVPQEKQGIYAIYAKSNSDKNPNCFYVGISGKNIYGRLTRHLREDIKHDYRKSFKNLENVSEIVICCGTTKLSEKKAKNQLILLEACMTVLLRPGFLGGAAAL